MTRITRSLSVVSIAAVVSLALGIGATTAIFTLVNSVLLRPLPVRDRRNDCGLAASSSRLAH